jgi:hypothetical protein
LDDTPKTPAEIGDELGLSTERVRQIVVKALRMLRHPSRSRQLSKWVVGGKLSQMHGTNKEERGIGDRED